MDLELEIENDEVPNKEPVNEIAVTFVLISSPAVGEMEADTEPEDICDRFNPVIPDAGIPLRSAPDPEKEPVIPAVTVKDPVIVELLCAMSPLRAMNSFAIIS